MKILFYSDFYAWNVMGTKHSIFEEMLNRGHVIMFKEIKEIKEILPMSKIYKPDQIWLVHSGSFLPQGVKKKINIPIVGFGFSDPYYFTKKRFENYDAYITYHFGTWQKYHKEPMPILYCQTACDFKFHKNLHLMKPIDLSTMGVGVHPRFKNPQLRIQIVKRLRKETDFNIWIYGRKWDQHPNNKGHIDGQEFLKAINRTKLGLDIQENWCPLAHKIFEYSACGTPVITPDRDEIRRVFIPGKEILTYASYDDLKSQINYYLNQAPEKLEEIGKAAQKRCREEHNIDKRVDRILEFLKGAIGN